MSAIGVRQILRRSLVSAVLATTAGTAFGAPPVHAAEIQKPQSGVLRITQDQATYESGDTATFWVSDLLWPTRRGFTLVHEASFDGAKVDLSAATDHLFWFRSKPLSPGVHVFRVVLKLENEEQADALRYGMEVLKERIANLQGLLAAATDPAVIANLKDEIGRDQAQLLAVQSALAATQERLDEGSVTITISTPLSVVIADESNLILYVGQKASLSSQVRDLSGAVFTGAAPQWSSSAPGIAAVDTQGTVTGMAPGEATLQASLYGVQSQPVHISVVQVSSKLRVDLPTATFSSSPVFPITGSVQDGGASVSSPEAGVPTTPDSGGKFFLAEFLVPGENALTVTETNQSETQSVTANITYFDGRGKSLAFNGTTSVARVDLATAWPSSSGGVFEAWINPSRLGSEGTPIMSTSEWEVSLDSEGRVLFTEPGLSPSVVAGTPIRAGEWTHIALVLGSSSGVISIYENGVLRDSVQVKGAISPGRSLVLGGPGFEGMLDELRFYSAPLGAAEIQNELFNPLPVTDPRAQAYFSFGGPASQVMADDTSHGGTLGLGTSDAVEPSDPWLRSAPASVVVKRNVLASQGGLLSDDADSIYVDIPANASSSDLKADVVIFDPLTPNSVLSEFGALSPGVEVLPPGAIFDKKQASLTLSWRAPLGGSIDVGSVLPMVWTPSSQVVYPVLPSNVSARDGTLSVPFSLGGQVYFAAVPPAGALDPATYTTPGMVAGPPLVQNGAMRRFLMNVSVGNQAPPYSVALTGTMNDGVSIQDLSCDSEPLHPPVGPALPLSLDGLKAGPNFCLVVYRLPFPDPRVYFTVADEIDLFVSQVRSQSDSQRTTR